MADIKSLEHPTLKVPYEILNKKFRSAQKTLDREVSHVQQSSTELEKTIQQSNVQTKEITKLLGGMVEKLQVLKRKAQESISDELQATNVCKRRLEHLKEHEIITSSGNVSQGSLNQWRRKRLDRMIVEYFLRNGYYNAAITLAERSKIKDLTNIEIFLTSREVERSLAKRETSKCLIWCHDNKSKLRKFKSNMEFNLRMQEFIELIRADRRMDAIKHSRKHFATFEEEHLPTIQQAMALLAFPVNTEIQCYKALFDEARWDFLIEQFRKENYRLFQLASQSVFTVALQAGLSALKTPQCYSENVENRNPDCPICHGPLNKLAEPLPFAHCSQSRLYCHISGMPLNENNQPMMLPNGFVYGEQALDQMARDNNGKVVCPKTKEEFNYKKVEKVFVIKDPPKPVRALVWIPGPREEPEKLLKRLEKQNYFSTEGWEIVDRREDSKGQRLVVLMDRTSWETMGTECDHRPNLNFTKVQFRLLSRKKDGEEQMETEGDNET